MPARLILSLCALGRGSGRIQKFFRRRLYWNLSNPLKGTFWVTDEPLRRQKHKKGTFWVTDEPMRRQKHQKGTFWVTDEPLRRQKGTFWVTDDPLRRTRRQCLYF